MASARGRASCTGGGSTSSVAMLGGASKGFCSRFNSSQKQRDEDGERTCFELHLSCFDHSLLESSLHRMAVPSNRYACSKAILGEELFNKVQNSRVLVVGSVTALSQLSSARSLRC